jgi:glucokinase
MDNTATTTTLTLTTPVPKVIIHSCLIGDIGGTNSRLSIQRISHGISQPNELIKTEILVSKDYKDVVSLLKHFLKQFEGTSEYPVVGVLGIAGPIFHNSISLIANLPWPGITGEEVAKQIGLKEVHFLNDFVVNG